MTPTDRAPNLHAAWAAHHPTEIASPATDPWFARRQVLSIAQTVDPMHPL